MPTINFQSKTFVQNHHLAVKYHELVPSKKKSLTDTVSLHDNLVLHGDNLLALKALLPIYAGQVKCAYIDPPYNTGKENWIYNDNVRSPMLQQMAWKVVDKDDLTRHDKWSCMDLASTETPTRATLRRWCNFCIDRRQRDPCAPFFVFRGFRSVQLGRHNRLEKCYR
jgi:hypothetical protein